MALQCSCFSGPQYCHLPRNGCLEPFMTAGTYDPHYHLDRSTKTMRMMDRLAMRRNTDGWGFGGSGGGIRNPHEYCADPGRTWSRGTSTPTTAQKHSEHITRASDLVTPVPFPGSRYLARRGSGLRRAERWTCLGLWCEKNEVRAYPILSDWLPLRPVHVFSLSARGTKTNFHLSESSNPSSTRYHDHNGFCGEFPVCSRFGKPQRGGFRQLLLP